MKAKKINNWAVGTPVGVVLLGIISSFIYDHIKNKPILSTIIELYNSVRISVVGFLNVEVKLWKIFLTVLVYLLLKKFIRNLFTQATSPEFLTYKKDIFHSWIWRWDYELVDGSWNIKDLTPYCPECDVELSLGHNIYRTWATCPKKKNSYEQSNQQYEFHDDVEKLIKAKIYKKEFVI